MNQNLVAWLEYNLFPPFVVMVCIGFILLLDVLYGLLMYDLNQLSPPLSIGVCNFQQEHMLDKAELRLKP